MAVDIHKNDADRLRYLRVLYEYYDETTRNVMLRGDVRELAGLDTPSALRAERFLVDEGLIRLSGFHRVITQQGIKLYETALREPDRATSAFPAYNFVIANHISNASIQQAGHRSDQSADVAKSHE